MRSQSYKSLNKYSKNKLSLFAAVKLPSRSFLMSKEFLTRKHRSIRDDLIFMNET